MQEFDNPNLQEILDKSQDFLEKHKKQLDLISRDIKQLEAFLQKNPIIDFDMHLQFAGVSIILSFKDGRIMHHEGQTIKPLIETKVEQRLLVAPFLAGFFEKAILNLQKRY